ncbi:hypothetical protein Tco_1014345, partial [Tanacetum coccineum]
GARSTSSDSTAPLLPDHPLIYTSPTLVPFLRRTVRMVVHVPPAMSPGLSASIAELVKDDEEEDEEVEESSDSDSESDDAGDEGPTTKDEGPAAGDEGLVVGDEGPGIRVESLGLGRDEVEPEGQQRAAPGQPVFEVGQGSGSVPDPERPKRVSALRQPTLTTWIDPEDGRAYIDVPAYPPPAPPIQTIPSSKWSFGSLPVSTAPSIVPSPISSPMIPLIVPS